MRTVSERKAMNALLSRRLAASTALLVTSVALASFWTSTSALADDLSTVTIGKAVDTIPYTVEDVGIAEGFFKKNGVKVKDILLAGSSATSAAMIGGSLQFAFEGAVPLMLARSRGVPLIAIDGVDDAMTLQILVSTKWLKTHPVSMNSSLKQKMRDLNGSVLGEIGPTYVGFYALLRGWAGLPKLTGYRQVSSTSQAAGVVALQNGLVDVLLQSPPHSFQLIRAGEAIDFIDRRDVPQFNNVAYDLLTTTEEFAKKNPKITKAVATAVAESANFMRQHPKETLAIEERHYPKLSASVLRKSLKFIPFAKNALQSQEGWNRAVTLAEETGLVKGVDSAPEGVYWTNKYIDLSTIGENKK